MWLKRIPFFHDMFRDLITYMLFNTIQEYPDGITLYDLKKIGNIPHSRLYRMMKRHEEHNYLVVKEEHNELGRPKHLYFFSDEGRIFHQDLKTRIIDNFGKLKEISDHSQDFDATTFLDKISFTIWENPLDRCLKHGETNEAKLQHLRTLEEHTFTQLTQIRDAITQIQKNLENTGETQKNE